MGTNALWIAGTVAGKDVVRVRVDEAIGCGRGDLLSTGDGIDQAWEAEAANLCCSEDNV